MSTAQDFLPPLTGRTPEEEADAIDAEYRRYLEGGGDGTLEGWWQHLRKIGWARPLQHAAPDRAHLRDRPPHERERT